MKQKTFQFDDDLASAFEHYCAQRQLIEKRIAAAAVLHFMEMGPAEREAVLLRLDRWIAGDRVLNMVGDPSDTPRLAAKQAQPPRITPAREPRITPAREPRITPAREPRGKPSKGSDGGNQG